MPTISPKPEWADEYNAVMAETFVDALITDRVLNVPGEPLLGRQALSPIAELVMAALYAAIDSQVVIYQNEMAYAGVQQD